MTQNKKKGIAKKALSISLVAAMLATSNVPAWASGFEAVDDGAGFTVEGEAPAMEGVDTYDTNMLAASPVGDTTALEAKLAEFAWDQAPEKMAEALKAAKEVKVAGQSYAVASAKVGYALNSASVTGGALNAGDTFVEWTSGAKYNADTVGKLLVAELKADADSEPYYVAGETITAAAIADAKDWSVTINGKTFKKDATDLTIPAADEYNVEKVSITMRDGSVTALDSVQTELTSNLTATVTNVGVVSIQFVGGYKGFTNVALTFNLEVQNKSMSEVVSIASGTLTYDVAGLEAQAKKLVTAKDGSLKEGIDYDVSLASDAKGERPITGTVNAGDKVYIVVSGTAGSDYDGYKKYVSGEYTVAAKNLSTLYLDPDVLDVSKIEYANNLNLADLFKQANVFKYDKDSTTGISDITTYDTSALDIKYYPSATPKAGEKVTVTIEKKSNTNANYTGTYKVEFTPVVSQDSLETVIGTAFNQAVAALNTKGLVYDGTGWNVDKLFKDPISEFTRAEYKISCVEVPSGNVVDAGAYTLEMTIIGGAYAGQSVKATTQLAVTAADLQSFQYGKGITYNTITWEPGLKRNDSKLEEMLDAVLTFGNTKLVKDKDYTVDAVIADDGADADAAAGNKITLKISGVTGGNFDGAVQVSCAVGAIKARALPELPTIPTQEYKSSFAISDIKVTNEAGDEVVYLNTVKDGDYTLQTADYEAKLSKIPTSGEGQVTLTLIGKGNYAGSVQTKTFEITKQAINGTFKFYKTANQVDSKLPALSYNYNDANAKEGIVYGDSLFLDKNVTTPEANKIVVVKENGEVVDPANYTISYKNNTAVGTATIEANGKDGYDLHAVANFEITPMQVTTESVTGVLGGVAIGVDKTTGYDYTGEAIIPKVTLTKSGAALKDGKYTLVEGTDYKVELKNNVNVPESGATGDKAPQIIVTGLGNYVFNEKNTANIKDNTGIKANFVITAVTITKASITAKAVEYAGGLEVTPDITVISPVTKKTLVAGTDYKLELEDAVNAGTATAKISAVDKNQNFTFTGGTIEVKFEITKKPLSECIASVVNGKVVIKNNGILVPASEYTVTEKDGVYTVKAAEKNYTGTITVKETVLEAPVLKVSNRTTSTVSLAWDKVEGAQGYTIWFRSEHDSSVSRKIVNGGDVTTWKQSGLQAGTKYFYTVKAWIKDAEGNYVFSEQSKTQRGTTKPMAAKITAASASNGKIKVTLAGKAAGAEKYSMCYADSRSAFAANNFKVGIRTSYTSRTLDKTFSKGTYYVCVKSYRDLGNGSKVYGAWSNTFKVVVK